VHLQVDRDALHALISPHMASHATLNVNEQADVTPLAPASTCSNRLSLFAAAKPEKPDSAVDRSRSSRVLVSSEDSWRKA